ncbi:hypothetical protein FDUTEX481_09626 [Tolypothrix sp. PCC 7601]|nr:hypothetical protein FDUTEX481_09626 [Tolypothrix sp. PCC 7601]
MVGCVSDSVTHPTFISSDKYLTEQNISSSFLFPVLFLSKQFQKSNQI